MNGYSMNSANLQAAQQQLVGLQQQYEQLQSLMSQTGAGTEQSAPVIQTPTVAGIDGARRFKLGPNSAAALMDVDEQVFYWKTTDANGVEAPIKVCPFAMHDAPKSESDYVTVKDFNELKADIRKLLDAQNTSREEAQT